MEESTIMLISAVSFLLILSGIAKIIGQYIKIPFTILLIVTGFIAAEISHYGPTFLDPIAAFKVNPYLILYVCLPTLVFESAYAMDSRMFQRNLLPIMTLALPGLFISAFMIATLTYTFTSLDFLTCLLLGSILSGTDPAAVMGLFKQLGVPKRLSLLVEGESLLNDSTAIVATKTVLTIILVGYAGASTIFHATTFFLWEFFGGIAVGIIMTYIFGFFIRLLRSEPIAQLSLVVIMAYLSFIIANEVLEVSGVMASIMNGIIMSGWGRTKLSVEANHYIHNLLKLLAYIANALIFLLVGFTIHLGAIELSFIPIIVVIASMLLSRAVVIFGLIPLINKFTNIGHINTGFQTIIWWGGLRGSIGLALVLSLTMLPNQNILISIVMCAVLFTILVQGLTIQKWIKFFKLDRPDISDRVAKLEAEIAAERKTLERLPGLQAGRIFPERLLKTTQHLCDTTIQKKKHQLEQLREHKLTEKDQLRQLYLNCFAVEKHLISEMYNNRFITGPTFHNLNYAIDVAIDRMRYHNQLLQTISHSFISQSKDVIINFIYHIGLLHKFINRIKIQQTISFYEFQWGMHQNCLAVHKYLEEMKEDNLFKQDVMSSAKATFKGWSENAKEKLDIIESEFPDFVKDMQLRLVKRVSINAKHQAIQENQERGLLPEGIAEQLEHIYQEQLRMLKDKNPKELEFDALELLKRIPFLKDIPQDRAQEVLARLEEMHVTQGEYLFHQGDKSNDMYLILRGLVSVIKDKKEITTLKPGDYFGEIAIIKDVKRTASCKAATPCLLYVLSRDQLEELATEFPWVSKELEQTAEQRLQI